MHAQLGNYRVERKLADGGMGSVYLGISPAGTRVVLKVPHAHDRDSQLALADEARAGMRLKHPAIVETLDFFVDRGQSVLVVAYVNGPSLFEMRKRAGALPAAAIAEMGAALAGALDAIHSAVDEQGRPLLMIHRDVSPNNVLVDATGQVHLIDLGIVRSRERTQKATLQGMVKGTLRYLAPEILNGSDHSASTDLFALGLTLWEAALGHYAIAGDEMNAVRAMMDGSLFTRLHESPIDGALIEVLAALVAPPEQRLRNARAATSVLSRLAQRLPGGRALLSRAARAEPSGASARPSPTSSVKTDPAPEPTEIAPRDVIARVARSEDSADMRPSPRVPSRVVPPEASAPTMLASRGEIADVFASSPSHAPPPPRPSAAPVEIPTAPSVDPPDFDELVEAATIPPPSPPIPPPRPVTMAPIPHAALDVAPTIQMPAVDPPFKSPPPRSDSIESAPTIQMGAWTPASGPMKGVGVPPKPPPPPAVRTPTQAKPTPPPPASITPANAPQKETPPAKRTGSLFLPIVIVDEDGDEID